MSKNDIDKIIEYLEQDMVALVEGIEKNEPILKKILDLIKSARIFFSIDYWGFAILLRKYCFDNFTANGHNLMMKRIDLINRIFYSQYKIEDYNFYIISPLKESSPPASGSLIFFLYLAIFERLHSTSKSIREIFHELLVEWETTISTSQMNVSLIYYTPIYAKLGDYKIAKDISLSSRIPHLKIDETIDEPPLDLILTYNTYLKAYRWYNFNDPDDLEPISSQRCYLVYKTQLPIKSGEVNLELSEEEKASLHLSNELLQKKFQEIINTFYLFGFDFNYRDYIIKLPWWYEFDLNELDKYEDRVEYQSEFTNHQIKEFSKFYANVDQSNIFHEKQFEIILYRYHQIYNRDYLPDIILDASIILEMLFTREMKQELKFRFSLNGALFLATNWEEFKKYQKVLDRLYDLRSEIIHGGDWEKKIQDYVKKEIFLNHKFIPSSIRALISQILNRIILLKLKDPNILNKFRQKNYFLEQSDLFNENKK